MAKQAYQKKQPMTDTEKRRRDAEAAAVQRFLRNPTENRCMAAKTRSTVKTITIKDAEKNAMKAATLLQSAWRGVAKKETRRRGESGYSNWVCIAVPFTSMCSAVLHV